MQNALYFLALVFTLIACDREKPVAPAPAGGQPQGAVPAPSSAPQAPAPMAAEPEVIKTADGEFAGSTTADFLGGKACIELYLSGQYEPDLIFEAKRNLAQAGVFSAKPCDPASATARCKVLRTDDGVTETLIGFYYDIPVDVAKQDCADDGGEFSAL